MKCQCGNDGRYVTWGGLVCGLCAMGKLSIRLVDIPEALDAVSTICDELEGSPICPKEIATLRSLIGRPR